MIAITTGLSKGFDRIGWFGSGFYDRLENHNAKATLRVIREWRHVMVIATGFGQTLSKRFPPKVAQNHPSECQRETHKQLATRRVIRQCRQVVAVAKGCSNGTTQPHNKSDATRFQTVLASGCNRQFFCAKVATGMTVSQRICRQTDTKGT